MVGVEFFPDVSNLDFGILNPFRVGFGVMAGDEICQGRLRFREAMSFHERFHGGLRALPLRDEEGSVNVKGEATHSVETWKDGF